MWLLVLCLERPSLFRCQILITPTTCCCWVLIRTHQTAVFVQRLIFRGDLRQFALVAAKLLLSILGALAQPMKPTNGFRFVLALTDCFWPQLSTCYMQMDLLTLGTMFAQRCQELTN